MPGKVMCASNLINTRLLKYAQHIFLCLLSLLLVCSFHLCTAQNGVLLTDYYSINDGLSDRLVTQIIQNKDGFLWLATPNGLNKFDGYEFTVYNDHPSNPRNINEVNIAQLAETDKGEIILVYRNNYVFFDVLNPRTDEVKKVSLLPGDGIMGIVRDIKLNKSGTLEILSNHNDTLKLFQYRSNGSFDLIFDFYSKHKNQTAPVHFINLSDGSYLISDSENGLCKYSPENQSLKYFPDTAFECLEPGQSLRHHTNILHQDGKGRIWLSFQNIPGIYLYNPKQETFDLLYGHEEGMYTHIWEDDQQNVLLAKTTGIGFFPKTLNLYCIGQDNRILDFSYMLDLSTHIIDIYGEDFFKTLFLAIDTGLKIVQNNRNKIKIFLNQDLAEGQRGNVMRGITGDGQGKVYMAREVKNWYALDLASETLDTLDLVDPKTGEIMEFNCCMDIHYEAGYLWGISCQKSAYAQLIKYHIATQKVETFIYQQRFTAFIKSTDGNFWLTYQTSDKKGGLVAFDPISETWMDYKDQGEVNPLRNVYPSFILESSDQMLWIASDKGLFKVDRKEKSTLIMTMPADANQKGLLSDNIYVVIEDAFQYLWIGSSNGLNRYNPKNGEFLSYDMSNGLANNQICGIIPDEENNLWISTYNGLSYFDTDSKLFKNFYKTDGLSEDEFNRFSFYKDENGAYYFGGVNGVNIFIPEDLLVSENNPPLVLTKLTRYNSAKDTLLIQTSDLNYRKELVIQPYDTYFQLNFSLPNYIQSKKNQFVSKLEGFENNWNYLGNTPQVRYNNLPPGNYTLLLRGADANGNWNSSPLRVKIRVRPIFYETLGAKVALVGILAFVLIGIFQYQLEQRLKVERLRTKISSDLHDEVSGLLSGIAMQTDVLKTITNDEISKDRLKSIGEVSRMAMNKMSDVIWSIDSRKDKVEDLIHRMREHADDILVPLNIECIFEIGKIDKQKKLPVEIRQNLYFIFKEAINNVVKHSSADKVVVNLGNKGQRFELKIQDNGNGALEKSTHKSKKTGQGISNLKMRAQRIDALLDIINADGFTVKVEMKKFA